MAVFALSGCQSDADKASDNLSTAAENFEIKRRVVFYNGITDKYIVMYEGYCSVEFESLKSVVTCKTGETPNGTALVEKHYMAKADNAFPVVQQLESAETDTFKTRIIYKPENIIPDIELKTSAD